MMSVRSMSAGNRIGTNRAETWRDCSQTLRLRKSLEAGADPVDHDARGGVAAQMVLHQEPDVAAAGKLRGAEPPVGQEIAAEIIRQHADRAVAPDQRAQHADVVADEARLVGQPARVE